MNYNAIAFAVMLSGVAFFYVLFILEPQLMREWFIVLAVVETVAIVLFMYADLDKRLRKLEQEKS